MALVMLALVRLLPAPAVAAPVDPSTREQRLFQQAAAAFHVPVPVLLAVSYEETRWDDHGTLPSTSGGYGVMHLTLVQPAGPQYRVDPALRTLAVAARLMHRSTSAVIGSERANIRAGAALLAHDAHLVSGRLPRTLAGWYPAAALYSGEPTLAGARAFADDVFALIKSGAARVTMNGQRVVLRAQSVRGRLHLPASLHLLTTPATAAECPRSLGCSSAPAAYALNSATDPTDYGNYDVANRPADGLDVRYIVIHDTEGSYASAIAAFQNSMRYASSNYVIRAADGAVTQMVPDHDVAWHAGNYYVNTHAIGIEHEGVAIQGASWYGEQLYHSSARLVRYLAKRFNIPLDRAHIFGHDEVPGPTPATQTSQHWDPGPFWDWGHFMQLVHAPLPAPAPVQIGSPVVITPPFAENTPRITDCSPGSCRTLPAQPANFVYLYGAPDTHAPLLNDVALRPAGGVGTQQASDWGDKAVTGQEFVVVDHAGDWDAIDYGGQEAWIHDPGGDSVAAPAAAMVVRPRDGLASIPVYGSAYPLRYPPGVIPPTIMPLQYTIPAGQAYVASDLVNADLYWSPTMSNHQVVEDSTLYYQIYFNHRFAFVRQSDVQVVLG